MILAVNIGNSKIALGLMEDGAVRARFALSTDQSRTEDEYAVLIRDVLSLGDVSPRDISDAVISSVVPTLNEPIARAIGRQCTGVKPMIVGAGVKTGLNIRIDNPAQLGCDLAVAAVGALEHRSAPLVIISMGTATTFMVIDQSGSLIGVSIASGVGLSVSALATSASLLPQVQINIPKSCIGTNTADCMRSGAVYGTASMIDGMIERIERTLGYPVDAVATGDHAELITHECFREVAVDPDMLFTGLYKILIKNRKNGKIR